MPPTMFTIGYQGASLADLIESLASADVSVVVDTRDSPHSRRPEFRPRSLEAALAEVGIRYLAARALGAPKDLRAQAIGESRVRSDLAQRWATASRQVASRGRMGLAT